MNETKIHRISHSKNGTKVLVYCIIAVLSVVYLGPFLWMVLTSLKNMQEIYQYPPSLFPKSLNFENYVLAVSKMPFVRYTLNTVVITLLTVLGTVISSSMVAYSIAKIKWRGRKYLFPLIMGTMLIPSQVTMIPLYIVFTKLNMVGSIAPLVIPAFLGNAYYIFLLRQFFKTIPDAYIESATIDGAGDLTIFLKIMLPLCKPALVSVGIFTFLNSWSDFMGPLLYLNKEEQYTLSLGLQAFMQTHFVEWGPLMAASALFTVPIIILFFFAQKYFIEGITVSGIKG